MLGAGLLIVAPTFNERQNVPILVERLSRLLPFTDWEILFVDDDSPDGTAAVPVPRRNREPGALHPPPGRRGLAGACLEGMLASPARFLVVMDPDLQHDEGLLVAMLDHLHTGRADLSSPAAIAPAARRRALDATLAHEPRREWLVRPCSAST